MGKDSLFIIAFPVSLKQLHMENPSSSSFLGDKLSNSAPQRLARRDSVIEKHSRIRTVVRCRCTNGDGNCA